MRKRKDWLALILAALVFVAALTLLKPPPQVDVIVAARDLPPGHVLTENDVQKVSLPQAAVPPDAFTSPAEVVGQPLAVARSAGDVLRPGHLGRPVQLDPDEREIGLQVVDASGLAGTLALGDRVGVVAIVEINTPEREGVYSKAVIEGLRVTYVDPDFVARESQVQPMPTGDTAALMMASYRERAHKGVVNVAVPISLQAIVYEFPEPDTPQVSRTVNALELLAALSSSQQATLYLYRLGDDAAPFDSPGLWLPDLLVFPATATPTPTPEGWQPGQVTPTATLTTTPTPQP